MAAGESIGTGALVLISNILAQSTLEMSAKNRRLKLQIKIKTFIEAH